MEKLLDKELFKESFGDWYPLVEQLFDDNTMDTIYTELKALGNRGKKIAPLSHLTYRAFKLTSPQNVKVVMMGLCPYHTIIDKKQVADGILMSCSNHNKYIAPSLEKFYEGLEKEYKTEIVRVGDLSYLSEQGVFMFNAALTTEIGKAKAHQELWKEFTKYILSLLSWDIPVIFLGKEAAEFKRYLLPMQWHFELSHPASAAYNKEVWDTQRTFKKVNDILKDLGKSKINWFLEEPPF